MIASSKISAVLVSTDVDRAQRFYEEVVGLPLAAETIERHPVFECGGGTTLLIYPNADGNRAEHTQVRFWSTSIDEDVAELADRGVKFELYEADGGATVTCIVTSANGRYAKFKDPDGNTLAVFQPN